MTDVDRKKWNVKCAVIVSVIGKYLNVNHAVAHPSGTSTLTETFGAI